MMMIVVVDIGVDERDDDNIEPVTFVEESVYYMGETTNGVVHPE